MKACLNIYHGKDLKQSFPLSKKQTSVGSGSEQDLPLADSDAGDFSFNVIWNEGKFFAHPVLGAKVCQLNQQELPQAGAQLRVGDRIQVGKLAIVFEIARENSLSLSDPTLSETKITRVTKEALDETQETSFADDVDTGNSVMQEPTHNLDGPPQKKTPAKYAVRVMHAKLVLNRYRLGDEIIYIGRMAENHISIDDPLVSRSHALIQRQGETYLVKDQESENGIYLNDVKVGQAELKVGDIIRIGEHELHFELADDQFMQDAKPEASEDEADEEWRMNMTLNLSPEDQAKILDEIKGKAEELDQTEITQPEPEKIKAMLSDQETTGERAHETTSPTALVNCTLAFGENILQKSIAFDSVEKAPEGEVNELEISVKLDGNLYRKKIPLD